MIDKEAFDTFDEDRSHILDKYEDGKYKYYPGWTNRPECIIHRYFIKPGIRFRRSCAGSPYRDYIIDDTVFMLYADALDSIYNVRINNISDLRFTNIYCIVINLYAQSCTFPNITINLGAFKVRAMDSDYNGNNVLTNVHLEISRIH